MIFQQVWFSDVAFRILRLQSKDRPTQSTAQVSSKNTFDRRSTYTPVCAVLCGLVTVTGLAQQPLPRITDNIDNTARKPLNGCQFPLVRAHIASRQVESDKELQGISLSFTRSDQQEADLKKLIQDQQTKGSPYYHQWLTPEQFAARFGMADTDLAKVQSWLQSQGHNEFSITRSKNRIRFSGTAGQIASTLGTTLNYYTVGNNQIYAPSNGVTIPSALSSVVQGVENLTSLRPQPHLRLKANFTSGQTGDHYLSPGDIATIYDINRVYNAGYTGAGQSITVVGQTFVDRTDIENFQTAAGLPLKDPIFVPVPNSGDSNAISSTDGDQAESDLDLEWSGAIAKDATIKFVYVGNNANSSVFDALQYAVDNQTSPIISISYGTCEANLSPSDVSTLEATMEQAASQGQTIVAASGDSGSTDCYQSSAQNQDPAVDYPASSVYAIGIGGTEFSGDVTNAALYWQPTNGSNIISSALTYIPETVWNDDDANGLASGGGGVSTLFDKPTWQTGVPGIPSDGHRDVPDISLAASANHDGYLFCSQGSCSNGLPTTIAGGTSFGAPIFAGMLALMNQNTNLTGQGSINSILYSLASNSTTYASAFHDITTGGNQCTAGSTICSTDGANVYAATTGYDLASGLGSVSLYSLLTSWPGSASLLSATATILSAATTTPALGATDTITISVASRTASSTASSTTTPTGTITIVIDGTAVKPSLPLSTGSATYPFSSIVAGPHTIVAQYSGDSTYAASTGTVTVTVGSSSPSTGSFSLTATNLTVASGGTGTSTITITPANGYAGTIKWSIVSNTTPAGFCPTLPNTTITGAGVVTAILTINTSSTCTVSANLLPVRSRGSEHTSAPIAIAFVGLLTAGFAGWRSRKLRLAINLTLLFAIGITISGCGSGASKEIAQTSTAHTVTITGTDTTTSSTTASATMILTIN